jgi:hypothetical protein
MIQNIPNALPRKHVRFMQSGGSLIDDRAPVKTHLGHIIYAATV